MSTSLDAPPLSAPSALSRRAPEIVLATLVISIGALLVAPLPPWLLDGLLATNVALAMLVLLVGLSVERPLSISAFPAVLLITTLLRLGLNVSSTRLILSQAYAGEVIEAFASWVVAGSMVVGVVIFLILTVVQFVVVARGGERVAEVSARFALDAMPGRQMAIDADLRAGALSLVEAQGARDELQRESRLYGAMDGAMKFVKGDAIAGLFILVVDIVGGVTVGVFEHDMGVVDALQRYGMLTIGDGLVTQIPALLIAISAALVVTRVASSGRGQTQHLGHDMVEQLGRHPRALAAASLFMVGLALMPGLPLVPFLALAIAGALATVASLRRLPLESSPSDEGEALPPRLVLEGPEDVLEAEGPALVTAVAALGAEWGLSLPVPIAAAGPRPALRILMDGFPVGSIPTEDGAQPLAKRVCEHLEGLLPELLSMQDVQRLLERWQEREPELVKAVVPHHLSLFEMTVMLRELLGDGVPIAPLRAVLEAALHVPADADPTTRHTVARRALGPRIAARLLAERRTVVVVGAGIAGQLRDGLRKSPDGVEELRLGRHIQDEIVDAIEGAISELDATSLGACALVVDERARSALRTVVAGRHPKVMVVSIEELAAGERAGVTLEVATTVDVGAL